MSERIGNWLAALANNLPAEMDTLREEIGALDRKKAEKLTLLTDYQELYTIATRRIPATQQATEGGE